MIGRLHAVGALWVTVFALLALCVLVSLGIWQLQRKAWKDHLQQQIDARVKGPPQSLAVVLRDAANGKDVAYTRVRLAGRFRHAAVQFLYAPGSFPDGLGWHVYTPLQLDDGRWVFVNRGFVPDRLRPPSARQSWQTPGDVEVTGLLRPAEQPGLFAPDNDPVKNMWYWRDLAGMTAAVFGGQKAVVVPYFVDADKTSSGSTQWPVGGTTRIALTNRHLEYAFTWFGLAFTLIGVWGAFIWSRLYPKPERL